MYDRNSVIMKILSLATNGNIGLMSSQDQVDARNKVANIVNVIENAFAAVANNQLHSQNMYGQIRMQLSNAVRNGSMQQFNVAVVTIFQVFSNISKQPGWAALYQQYANQQIQNKVLEFLAHAEYNGLLLDVLMSSNAGDFSVNQGIQEHTNKRNTYQAVAQALIGGNYNNPQVLQAIGIQPMQGSINSASNNILGNGIGGIGNAKGDGSLVTGINPTVLQAEVTQSVTQTSAQVSQPSAIDQNSNHTELVQRMWASQHPRCIGIDESIQYEFKDGLIYERVKKVELSNHGVSSDMLANLLRQQKLAQEVMASDEQIYAEREEAVVHKVTTTEVTFYDNVLDGNGANYITDLMSDGEEDLSKAKEPEAKYINVNTTKVNAKVAVVDTETAVRGVFVKSSVWALYMSAINNLQRTKSIQEFYSVFMSNLDNQLVDKHLYAEYKDYADAVSAAISKYARARLSDYGFGDHVNVINGDFVEAFEKASAVEQYKGSVHAINRDFSGILDTVYGYTDSGNESLNIKPLVRMESKCVAYVGATFNELNINYPEDLKVGALLDIETHPVASKLFAKIVAEIHARGIWYCDVIMRDGVTFTLTASALHQGVPLLYRG